MKILKRLRVVIATLIAAGSFSSAGLVSVSSAYADSPSTTPVVTSVRTFPAGDVVRKNLLVESTSTTVKSNVAFGELEKLNVPHTQSNAERRAQQLAAQRERERREAEQRRRQEEVSRSYERAAQQFAASAASLPTSGKMKQLVNFAVQFANKAPYSWGGNTPNGWDCSGMLQYVFAQVLGVRLPHSSTALMHLGTPVASLAQARPGDILANATHAALYIGNGLVVSALNYTDGTKVSTTLVFGGRPYVIRHLFN